MIGLLSALLGALPVHEHTGASYCDTPGNHQISNDGTMIEGAGQGSYIRDSRSGMPSLDIRRTLEDRGELRLRRSRVVPVELGQ
jgi:hypothetical protein